MTTTARRSDASACLEKAKDVFSRGEATASSAASSAASPLPVAFPERSSRRTSVATSIASSAGSNKTVVSGFSSGNSLGAHRETSSGASSAHCTPVAFERRSFSSVTKKARHGRRTTGAPSTSGTRHSWQKKRRLHLHPRQKTRAPPPSADAASRGACEDRRRSRCIGGSVKSGRRRLSCIPDTAAASASEAAAPLAEADAGDAARGSASGGGVMPSRREGADQGRRARPPLL